MIAGLLFLGAALGASGLVSFSAKEADSWDQALRPQSEADVGAAELDLFYQYRSRGGVDSTAEDESDAQAGEDPIAEDISEQQPDATIPGMPEARCLQSCEAAKMQCKEKACAGLLIKDEKDAPFKSCAHSDADRPRMLYAKGCSGSTWVQKVARELMRLHGYCVSPVAYEPLNPTSDVKRLFPNSTIGDSMTAANEYWSKQGATFVYKGTGALDSVFVRKKMRKLQAYAAVVWRSNALDHAVCMVRDCFSDKLGYAVDQDGKETEICFQRRKAPDADRRSFKVNLNMTNLLRQLAYMSAQGQRLGDDLKGSEFEGFEIITYEDLADYQRKPSQWTNTTDAFSRAVQAWSAFMRSWGVAPNEEIVTQYLRAGKETRDPPKLHSEMLYNYNEVRHMIQAQLRNWPEFQGLLRL